MAHLLVVGRDGLACVVYWEWHLGPRPLDEEPKQTGDVLDGLPGVLRE
jgi:hypothetical protein